MQGWNVVIFIKEGCQKMQQKVWYFAKLGGGVTPNQKIEAEKNTFFARDHMGPF